MTEAIPNVYRDAASARHHIARAGYYLREAVTASRCNGQHHVAELEAFRVRADRLLVAMIEWKQKREKRPRLREQDAAQTATTESARV